MRVICLIISSIFLLFSCKRTENADMVIINGDVYTVDSIIQTAQALALQGGRILFVGSTEEAMKLEVDDYYKSWMIE